MGCICHFPGATFLPRFSLPGGLSSIYTHAHQSAFAVLRIMCTMLHPNNALPPHSSSSSKTTLFICHPITLQSNLCNVMHQKKRVQAQSSSPALGKSSPKKPKRERERERAASNDGTLEDQSSSKPPRSQSTILQRPSQARGLLIYSLKGQDTTDE